MNHVQKLEFTLNKLKEKGLKYNIKTSFFGQTEMEYLGSWVTRDGAKPTNRKIQSIINIKPNTSQKGVRKFICVINYYCNMWLRRSHMLTSLTRLTSIKWKFKCTQVEQDAFDKIKRILVPIT